MNTPARREPRTLVSDLLDMLENPLTALRPSSGHAIRIEDRVQDDQYVVRAELPGIDPDRDLEISVARDVLTIRAERLEEHESHRHSEFRYGSYERHVRLPENVRTEEIRAVYDNGILTISVPFEEIKEATRRVPVEH
jgi:HSP20 family protein